VVQVVAVSVYITVQARQVHQVHQDKVTLVEVDKVAVVEAAAAVAVKVPLAELDITQVILIPVHQQIGAVLKAAQVEAELH
jgi:hypothetical protein